MKIKDVELIDTAKGGNSYEKRRRWVFGLEEKETEIMPVHELGELNERRRRGEAGVWAEKKGEREELKRNHDLGKG